MSPAVIPQDPLMSSWKISLNTFSMLFNKTFMIWTLLTSPATTPTKWDYWQVFKQTMLFYSSYHCIIFLLSTVPCICELPGKLVLPFKIQLKYNFLLTSNLIDTLGREDNVISAIAIPCTFFIHTAYQNYSKNLLFSPGLQLYCEIY